jgi:hypothetical protein
MNDRRADPAVRPHAATLGGHPFLDTDHQQFAAQRRFVRRRSVRPVRALQVLLVDRRTTAAGDPVRVHLWQRGIHSRLPRRGLISSRPLETDHEHMT